MSYEEHLKCQQIVIDKACEVAKQYTDVVGIYLSGSHALNDNTPYSDVDLEILFDSDTRDSRKKIHEDLISIFPTLSNLYLYDKDGLFLYENGVRLDVAYIKPTDFQSSCCMVSRYYMTRRI